MFQTLSIRLRRSFVLRLASRRPAGFSARDQSRAAGADVTAVLSNSNTAVGQPVQLQIKVTGSASARSHPAKYAVGWVWTFASAGQSQFLEGRNFQFTYSYIYNYTMMPLKAGTFKIPPQTFEAGGSALRTPELTLQVAAIPASAQSPRSNRSTAPVDPSKIAFAELILSKTNAYVGEMIPARGARRIQCAHAGGVTRQRS